MNKILIAEAPRAETETNEKVTLGCENLNNYLEKWEAVAPLPSTTAEVKQMIDDPAGLLVEKLKLRSGELGKHLAPKRIISMLDDPAPGELVEHIEETRTENRYALSYVVNEGLGKFQKGRFAPDKAKIEPFVKKFHIYAETEKEKAVFEAANKVKEAFEDLTAAGVRPEELNCNLVGYEPFEKAWKIHGRTVKLLAVS